MNPYLPEFLNYLKDTATLPIDFADGLDDAILELIEEEPDLDGSILEEL